MNASTTLLTSPEGHATLILTGLIAAALGIATALFWKFYMPKEEEPEPPEIFVTPPLPAPTAPPEIPMSQKIYEFAKECMGKDIAKTQNELGCSEAVSFILSGVQVPEFPSKGFLSTAKLYEWLKKNATRVAICEPGDIIISPTGESLEGAPHGHVGIVAKHGILSNNSRTFLFDEYFDLTKWTAYYHQELGFPIYFFRL